MELPLVGHLDAEVVARSPEPQTIYYSNPDWAVDAAGPLLLWDTFGGDFSIALARPEGDGWRKVADFPGAMHSHLIHLPDQGLSLVLGVDQESHPRAIHLWCSRGGDSWDGPVELFGGADFHAGSTPWAVHDGRLFVPFEVQETRAWGSYQYGAVHAALAGDLAAAASWTLTLAKVPWSSFPGCELCGALEGNLVVAPDGQLYNILRIPAYNRLGRARWNGVGWDWLGLVQGVHNQSKPELFQDPGSGRWYLLANGWPARVTPTIKHGLRNTLCLWEATEPDLSRWRFLRVVASDLVPRHAFSYVAGVVVPASGQLLIAERHGDDETRNYHDTNCVVVRRRDDFAAWIAEPAVSPYGHDQVGGDGFWAKANSQDGLLLSHLDGALYPMTLSATVRLDGLPLDIGALDLLGFATCDLVQLAGLQLVQQGDGAYLALSAGGERITLRDEVTEGEEIELELTLTGPAEVTARVGGAAEVSSRTHVPADPTLAGVLPRADRPESELGVVSYVAPPQLTAGDRACPAPELRDAWILVDGRGVTGPLPRDVATPAENGCPGGPPVCGGHARWFEPWAGGVMPGEGVAAVWSPLPSVPPALTSGGTLRVTGWRREDMVLLVALGGRSEGVGLERREPYLALLLLDEEEPPGPRLALAWNDGEERLLRVADQPVGEWLTFALRVEPGDGALQVAALAGTPGHAMAEVLAVDVAPAAVAEAPCWLALVGQRGDEVRSSGGLYLCRAALGQGELDAWSVAGYAVKMDSWPARRPAMTETPAAGIESMVAGAPRDSSTEG